MVRSLIMALMLSACATTHALAQAWANKMFAKTSHDFGTVAKGAKAEFRFEFENIYEEDIVVSEVRTSCGCTTPSIEKRQLKTWEKSAILATFNTKTFEGRRGANVTVVISKPYYAEVRLRVDGNIRTDVQFEPGQVELGELDMGQVAQKSVRVNFLGTHWKIADVRSANPNFEVELAETQRNNGRTIYEMLVRLKPTAPEGYLLDQLTIVTDQKDLSFTIPVQGRIVPPVQVSPALLTLGNMVPGQRVTKQLIVKGKSPFKITGVNCPDGCFAFKVSSEEAKNVHVIPVTFTAGDQANKIEQKIEIETNLGDGIKACCVATAVVSPAAN